jgi:TldD protein
LTRDHLHIKLLTTLKPMRFSFSIFLALTCFVSVVSAQINTDPLLSIVEDELKREVAEFTKVGQPPYFVSYRIDDVHSGYVSSSFGSLVSTNVDHDRILVTDVKVGDYAFDNSHPVVNYDDVDMPMEGRYGRSGSQLPLDDRKEAIQLQLWQRTESAYRNALAMYKALKNSPTASTTQNVHDFSKEAPSVLVEAPLPAFSSFYNKTEWEVRIKKFSAPFLINPNIVHADASLQVGTERKYFLSSEGTRVVQNRTHAYLTIRGAVLAEDGDILPLHLSYFAYDPQSIPSDEMILKDVNAMITKLETLRKAPLAEPYTGPAILHARTAGVFFHEIFGHRVEGHRLKNNSDGQTFKGKIGQLVLPKSLNVVFDPTVSTFNGQALNGFYKFDDEGVKAQPVKVVESGILKTFLMSRTPIENFSNSNGHGRAQAGQETVTRQSNLIIQNQKEIPMSDLRKMLISECKKQKKEYGYFFVDVIGGFTTTDRYMPNAFNIFPTEVYRVYIDGRPDELVRGVDLIGTPLAMFAEITAADNKPEIFTGFCGAESGSVPVTAVSPSLFVKRIETQKKATQQVEKTLLERPSSDKKTISDN